MSTGFDEAVLVALGGNLKGGYASCEQLLEAALDRFGAEGLAVKQRSAWWRSAAWPDPREPGYINGVAWVGTELGPTETLLALHRIEEAFGRFRERANAPRTLDLDLIAHGRRILDGDGLILPHPRAAERLFVMGPLAEIAPDWIHPVLGRTARALAAGASVGLDAAPV